MGIGERLDRAKRIGAFALACGLLGGAAGVVAVRAAGSETAAVASVLVPIEPVRVLDSRNGTGTTAGRLSGTRLVTFDGIAGKPATATAVTLNVTVTNASAAGFLTVTPAGSSAGVSSVNFVPGQDVANQVTVVLAPNGAVDVTFPDGVAADLIVDVFGFYVPATTGPAAPGPAGPAGPPGPQGPAGEGAPPPVAAFASVHRPLETFEITDRVGGTPVPMPEQAAVEKFDLSDPTKMIPLVSGAYQVEYCLQAAAPTLGAVIKFHVNGTELPVLRNADAIGISEQEWCSKAIIRLHAHDVMELRVETVDGVVLGDAPGQNWLIATRVGD